MYKKTERSSIPLTTCTPSDTGEFPLLLNQLLSIFSTAKMTASAKEALNPVNALHTPKVTAIAFPPFPLRKGEKA